MRTGNVLIRREVFTAFLTPFDFRFGRTGGEDSAFFARALGAGFRFVWCDEAIAYERVPPERQTARYHIRRALQRGVNTAAREPVLSRGTLKSLMAVPLYALAIPLLLVAGKHLAIRYVVKLCDHGAKLLAHAGIRTIRERSF